MSLKATPIGCELVHLLTFHSSFWPIPCRIFGRVTHENTLYYVPMHIAAPPP